MSQSDLVSQSFPQSFDKSDSILMPRLNLGSNPEEYKLSDKASSMGKRSQNEKEHASIERQISTYVGKTANEISIVRFEYP